MMHLFTDFELTESCCFHLKMRRRSLPTANSRIPGQHRIHRRTYPKEDRTRRCHRPSRFPLRTSQSMESFEIHLRMYPKRLSTLERLFPSRHHRLQTAQEQTNPRQRSSSPTRQRSKYLVDFPKQQESAVRSENRTVCHQNHDHYFALGRKHCSRHQ